MSSKVEQSRRYKCYSNLFQNVSDFDLKNWQFLVKLGSKLAKIRLIFLAISRAAFLARNVSQNHFSFSREMREMCMSNRPSTLSKNLNQENHDKNIKNWRKNFKNNKVLIMKSIQ